MFGEIFTFWDWLAVQVTGGIFVYVLWVIFPKKLGWEDRCKGEQEASK